MKINFTKEHQTKLENLAVKMLINNEVISTNFGQQLNVVEIMHTQTINTLNNIRIALGKHIENLEKQDEWVSDNTQQDLLDSLKEKKEFVNLIIGWKRYNIELAENNKKKEQLTKEIKALKESQKTPEDKIKDLEKQLSELDNF
jgi:cell division protein FtsB